MRRVLRRTVALVGLLAFAAGTSGDVPSLAERFDRGSAFAAATTTSSSTTTTEPKPTTTTAPPPPEWTLFAGGDVLMDRSETAGRDPFTKLVPAFSEADLTLVNVEMSIAEGGSPQAGKEFTFRAPASAAKTMAAAGVDGGNLGNNHSLDYGRDALLETVANLRSAGVAPFGAGSDEGEALAPATFAVGGEGEQKVSVAVLGASANVPGGWEAGAQPGIATTRGDRLVEAVRSAAADHGVVIVLVHWGQEGAPCPNDAQVELGDALVAAGADAVIGSHPHVLQPVVERGGGLIAYSLGNFVWHARPGAQGETGVLELRFVGDVFDGFSFHPHELDPNGDPEPAGAEATAGIEAAVADHCGVT